MPTPSTGGCVQTTIDFDTYVDGTPIPGGTYVEDQWLAKYGLRLSASGGFGNVPRIFNTSDVSDDSDLGSPNQFCDPSGPGVGVGGEPNQPGKNCVPQGNVLIIQEEDTEQPDANSEGGSITFDFTPKADYVYEIGLMSIDTETTLTVEYQDKFSDMKVTKDINIPLLGPNSVQVVPINLANVYQIRLTLICPDAVAFLSFCPG